MIIRELISEIESYAPLVWQASYDNSGLICGDAERSVEGVLLSVDVTEAVVDEAIAEGCNLIVSHHPLIFRGIKQITPNNSIGRSLIKAINHQIAIYAAHTNMDAAPGGISAQMAKQLELKNCRILAPEDETESHGYGLVGYLPAPIDAMELLKKVKTLFHCDAIRFTTPHLRQFHKIAVCGGAGMDLLSLALKAQADLFISSDFKYHDFFLADERITIADIGHYESEQFSKVLFYELITKKSTTFAVRFSKVNTNPINYL